MVNTTCSQCKRTGQILSSNNLCWNCNTTKEKTNYRYMINCKTFLFLSTILTCIFFLLNAIPTIRLGHAFTQNYSKITNDYIRIGKDLLFLLVYLIIKISICISIWKNRYVSTKPNYIHLITEFIIFIAKLVVMNQYFDSPLKAKLRLSGIIDTMNRYTEDTLSSEYLAFFLYYCLVFLVIRIVSCILAYVLNKVCDIYLQSFYEQHQYQKRINNIAHWEFYYHRHPNFYAKPDDQSVASKCEKTIQLEAGAIKEDLSNYIENDEKRQNTYLNYLLSQEDTLSMRSSDLELYLTYIKDKISIWKEDNLATDSHLEQDVIHDVTTKFNCIKDRFQSSMIENQTYFNLFWSYMNHLEAPLKQISNERRNIKQSIDQLYMYSDMLYWHKKCKENIHTTMDLFEKQAINLEDYSAILDGETISFDNILITNRGLFLLDVETFDSAVPFELMIERDGCWYKRYQDDNDLPQLESLSTSITGTNNYNLLKLEKQLNQLLNRSLDQYIELKGIVILANDDILLENNSTQSVIRTSELVTVLRSYPIQFNEEQMLHISSILTSQQIPTPNIVIPNYRKQIIEPLDTLLEQKIQLIHTNRDLINEINEVSINITKKNKFNFVPLYIRKSKPGNLAIHPKQIKSVN